MSTSSILTVVTPAADRMLVALEVVKEELDITSDVSDSRLSRWIREASAAVEGYIGRRLRLETVCETIRLGSGGNCNYDSGWRYEYADGLGVVDGLSLRRYPISSVTSIYGDDGLLDSLLDYEIDAELGQLYRISGSSRIAWYGGVLTVIYAGGYATTDDVPPDIQTACLLMVKHRSAALGRDPMLRGLTVPGVIEQQFWVPSGSDTGALPPEVQALIARYRDVHI